MIGRPQRGGVRNTKPNKWVLISAHLGDYPTANRKPVIEAWAKAGHLGTASTTLVRKTRRDFDLAGNLPGRPKPFGLNGSDEVPQAKSEGAKAKKAKIAPAKNWPTSTAETNTSSRQDSRYGAAFIFARTHPRIHNFAPTGLDMHEMRLTRRASSGR